MHELWAQHRPAASGCRGWQKLDKRQEAGLQRLHLRMKSLGWHSSCASYAKKERSPLRTLIPISKVSSQLEQGLQQVVHRNRQQVQQELAEQANQKAILTEPTRACRLMEKLEKKQRYLESYILFCKMKYLALVTNHIQ